MVVSEKVVGLRERKKIIYRFLFDVLSLRRCYGTIIGSRGAVTPYTDSRKFFGGGLVWPTGGRQLLFALVSENAIKIFYLSGANRWKIFGRKVGVDGEGAGRYFSL